MSTDRMVTVYCTTYNHEAYIKDALDGILMQETDFEFNVIVHDDASTDNTASIIREYENRYPNIIKAIYQTVNQYSKGHRIFRTFILPHADGKYLAGCEGDDYWTDKQKLQKQVDYLEGHPECALCVCATEFIDASSSRRKLEYPQAEENRIYSTSEIIGAGGGGLFHTVSFVYRRELIDNFPSFFSKYNFGDYPYAIYLSMKGTVYYMSETMTVHRVNVPNSWTDSVANRIENFQSHILNLIEMLKEIDEYSEFRYSDTIKTLIGKHQFEYHLAKGDYAEAKHLASGAYYRQMTHKSRVILNIKQYFPFLYSLYLRAKAL